MKTTKVDLFYIIGLSLRTTNENGKSGKDIPELWNLFLTKNIIDTIPNKIDNSIYCVYTDYEKDYTKPYTTILGCKVKNLDFIPDGLTGKKIEMLNYTIFTAKGNLMHGIVFNEWTKIWNTNLQRSYQADFEIYGEKSKNPENAEVDIFVGINE